MIRHPCSGCGLRHCEGQCFDESPEPIDEPTISTLTLADLRKLYGEPLTTVQGDPFLADESRRDPIRKRRAA